MTKERANCIRRNGKVYLCPFDDRDSGARDFPSVRVIPLSQMNWPSNPLQNPFGDPSSIDGIYVG